MYKIICRFSVVFISVLLENSLNDLLKSKKKILYQLNMKLSQKWNRISLLLYVLTESILFFCALSSYILITKKTSKNLLPAYLLMTACKALQYRSFVYACMLPKCSFFQLVFADLIVRYHASWQEYAGKLQQ